MIQYLFMGNEQIHPLHETDKNIIDFPITKNELFSKTKIIWAKSFRPSNTNKDLVGSGFDTSN